MSCMMLSDKHYLSCAESAFFRPHELDIYFGGRNRWEWEECKQFFARLRQWNERAYAERYREPDELLPLDAWENVKPLKLGLRAMQKALHCIRYQCIDASGFEESPEGKQLNALINAYSEAIVGNHEDYQKAAWAID